MTEIRIRHEYEPEGAVLGDVPLGDIGDVIDSLKKWGLNMREDDGSEYVGSARLSGEYVYDAVRDVAYFEVLVEAAE